MEKLKQQMREQIAQLTIDLEEARQIYLTAQTTVQKMETDLAKLQSALRALEGGEILVPPTPSPSLIIPASAARPGESTVTINGVEVILEPGMKVVKNSFGEDCIVSEFHPGFQKMEEPAKPVGAQVGEEFLPAGIRQIVDSASAEGFDSPEDLI